MVAGAATSLPIGVYRGSVLDLSQIQAYEAFLDMPAGVTVDFVLAFMVDRPVSWADFERGALQSHTNGPAGPASATDWGPLLGPRRLMLGVPACAMGTTWAQEAAGANDAHWTALGSNLIAAGLGGAVLRIAREMNTGYAWAVTPANAADHIAGWQHIVNLLRALPGAAFKSCWNPIIGQGSFGPSAGVESCYPDHGTVDVIGLDVYDWGYTAADETIRAAADQQAFFASQLTMWDGLNGWRSFAQSRNLSLCFPEWGLKLWGTGQSGASGYTGGGDNPYFIQRMAAFMKATGNPGDPLAMSALWEDTGMGVSDPDSLPARRVAVPAARARFLYEFGYGG
jgi:hypothetical protein